MTWSGRVVSISHKSFLVRPEKCFISIMSECKHLNLGSRNNLEDINPFTTKSDLIDFTLFNAR